MSVFKSQFSRALLVIPSSDANIPFPEVKVSGLPTTLTLDYLVDSNADFIASNVAPGDIVYNNSATLAATVVAVIDENTLLLNDDIFSFLTDEYKIYNASSQTSNGNPGCNLYVAAAGNIAATTIGQDEIFFENVAAGTLLPIQVYKLNPATTSTSVYALW